MAAGWRALGGADATEYREGLSIPVTIFLARAIPSKLPRLLHVELAAMRPAKMRIGGLNGTIVFDGGGLEWRPGRAARAVGAVPMRIPWTSVRSAAIAPTFAKGVPVRLLSVETSDGGFELQFGDRYEKAVSQAIARHLAP